MSEQTNCDCHEVHIGKDCFGHNIINESTLAPESEDTPRKGNWIRVYSGGKYYPLDPRPEEIFIEDIAHSISLLCRYNGHIDRFMSVAEHCWILSYQVPQEYALEALLHDASEAYMSDIPRPLKYAEELKLFREIENINTETINEKFGIHNTLETGYPTSFVVDSFDKRIVSDEKKLLFTKNFKEPLIEGLEPLGLEYIRGYNPRTMEKLYLDRFAELKP